tara:strand:+ start:240 stop:593 length:354 start_codon:yes stop_codon:yes gene_type:complete
MEREPVWYGDIDFVTISDDQYRANMYHQINEPTLPSNLSVSKLEKVADFIPLVTDDLRLTFCRVTQSLPELAQTQIWTSVLAHGTESFQPKTPRKKYEMSDRMKSHMARWKARKLEF